MFWWLLLLPVAAAGIIAYIECLFVVCNFCWVSSALRSATQLCRLCHATLSHNCFAFVIVVVFKMFLCWRKYLFYAATTTTTTRSITIICASSRFMTGHLLVGALFIFCLPRTTILHGMAYYLTFMVGKCSRVYVCLSASHSLLFLFAVLLSFCLAHLY